VHRRIGGQLRALKNAIDWVIRSGELEEKVIAITAAVPAPERGRRGLEALRNTLSAVRAVIVGGEPIAKGPDFDARVAHLLADLVQVIARAERVHGSTSNVSPRADAFGETF
jgi:NAD(P)H-dependent FMN reductase